jgi:hypothetical protein
LCEKSHGPSVNGGVLVSSIAMPGDADRTAASTAFDVTRPATLANEASAQIGRVVR